MNTNNVSPAQMQAMSTLMNSNQNQKGGKCRKEPYHHKSVFSIVIEDPVQGASSVIICMIHLLHKIHLHARTLQSLGVYNRAVRLILEFWRKYNKNLKYESTLQTEVIKNPYAWIRSCLIP